MIKTAALTPEEAITPADVYIVRQILAQAKRAKANKKQARNHTLWLNGFYDQTPYFQAALKEYRRLHNDEL